MSGRVESPYNRFQHASTNTAPQSSVTPIPLSRSGTGAELLQALRVSGEAGSLRPRRESMDSFNSLHRFTQQHTNGVSRHGQSAEGPSSSMRGVAVTPAVRTTQQPGLPRPSSSSAEVPPKNVWASAHFTYNMNTAASSPADKAATASGSAPLLNVTSTSDPSVTASRENRLGSDPGINAYSGASPIASASRHGAPMEPMRYSQGSHREDEVQTSYISATPPLAGENPPSPSYPMRYSETSPENTYGDRSMDAGGPYDEWASQERRLLARRQPPSGSDPHRPNGGVPTMLRTLMVIPARVPAINESVEVGSMSMSAADRARVAAPPPPPPPPASAQPLYVVTREILPSADQSYSEAIDVDDDEEEAVAEAQLLVAVAEAEAEAEREAEEAEEEEDVVRVSAQDVSRIAKPATIPSSRRRASYEGQRPGSERRTSAPSVRTVPITQDVHMDELDAIVPQARTPMPPSSTDTSLAPSRRSTPVPKPMPFTALRASIPLVSSPTPSSARKIAATPLTATTATTTSANTSLHSSSLPYCTSAGGIPPPAGVSRTLPLATTTAVVMVPAAEQVVASRSAGAPAVPAAQPRSPAATTTATPTPMPTPTPRVAVSHRTTPSGRQSVSSSMRAPAYTSAGAPQLHQASLSRHSSNGLPTGHPAERSKVKSSAASSLVGRASGSGPLLGPQMADTTRAFDATSAPSAMASGTPPPPSVRTPQPARTVRVPVTTAVQLAPRDHIPDSFHAPLPAPVLMEAMVPHQPHQPHPSGNGSGVLHYQPAAPSSSSWHAPNHVAMGAAGTVQLSTTTLSVEERKVRYLPLDQPFDPDTPDPTDVQGAMPMADTFALLHPSDYGRVLLANQPTVLALTDGTSRDGSHEPYDEEDPQQWAVQPTYLANNNHRWVRRSQRAPVATTHDPAGRAAEEARRLPRPALTDAEARAQTTRAPYAAFPAYQVTNTMTNRAVHSGGGGAGGAGVETAHDAAGGFLLQRHVQQIATGKLLAGTPSQMPPTAMARPAPASVPTSAGSRTANSSPATSTHSAPVYRPARQPRDQARPVGAATPPPRREPTVRGSAEDARGTPAMPERLPAIPGYAHSGSRPPLMSNAAPVYVLPAPASGSGLARPPPTTKTTPTMPPPASHARPSSQTSSQTPSQRQAPPLNTTTGRPASTATNPSVASSIRSTASRASQPLVTGSASAAAAAAAGAAAAARSVGSAGPASSAPAVPSSSATADSRRDRTPSLRAASTDTDKILTPATVVKPQLKPARVEVPVHVAHPPSLPTSARSSAHSASLRPTTTQPAYKAPVVTPATATTTATAIPRDTRPMQAPPPPATAAASTATTIAPTAPLRPLSDYVRPKPATAAATAAATTASSSNASTPMRSASSSARGAAAAVAAGIPPPPPPPPPAPWTRTGPPSAQARPRQPEHSMEFSPASRSPTHSASFRREDDMTEASFVSDGVDPVTEVQNHTMVAAPPGHRHMPMHGAVSIEPESFETGHRYTSTSPSLVQPSDDFVPYPSAPPGPTSSQWHGVVSVPTMRTNSAPPAQAPSLPPGVHNTSTTRTSSASPSITYEAREGSDLAVFARMDGPPPPMSTSNIEYMLSSTTVHHSSHSQSTPTHSQHHEAGTRFSHPMMDPSSADTLPIAVSERGEEDEEEDLTKKVRPTTLIVDGDVYELPRHESEELYFVPDDEGNVYYDEQNQEVYPVDANIADGESEGSVEDDEL